MLTEKDHIYCNNGLVLRPDGFMSDWTHPITGKEYKNGADGGGIFICKACQQQIRSCAHRLIMKADSSHKESAFCRISCCR